MPNKKTAGQKNETADEEGKKPVEKIAEKEFEKKILELAKKGLSAEKIGEELKKQNIHSHDYQKKISEILKENNLYASPDLKNVENKLKRIEAHFEKNRQDKRALNEKNRVLSQRVKIKRYLQTA